MPCGDRTSRLHNGRHATVWLRIAALGLLLMRAAHSLPEARPETPLTEDAEVRFDYDPGASYGLNRSAEVSQTTVMMTLRGAEQGNKESLYFLGLMRLYGLGMPKDEARAAEAFRLSAEKGSTDGETALGMMLYNGHMGLGRDYTAAAAYWGQAASKGHPEAQWLLGRLYYEGKAGSEANTTQALKWFRAAAAQENPNGHYYMGLMHEYGLSTPQDFKAAIECYEQAAMQGHLDGTYNLALMRAYGRGCAQDWQRASLLFQRAADRGHGPSAYYVGVLSLYGHGMPRNYDLALHWFERAAAANDYRISVRAAEASAELSLSLERAREANKQVQDMFMERQAADYDMQHSTMATPGMEGIASQSFEGMAY